MTAFIITVVLSAAAAAAVLYAIYTGRVLSRMENMLDRAVDGNFSEEKYSEDILSRAESKMYRFIRKYQLSERVLSEEKQSVESLVSDISHQTKTALSNIMLYSELLCEQTSSDTARDCTEKIKFQSEKLDFLISSFVKVSRLENGIIALNKKMSSIRELLSRLCEDKSAEQKSITLSCMDIPDSYAEFDFKWTLEALGNILSNAVKYTSSGGNITISAQEFEMYVRVDIEDTGIGISEEEIPKIFGRFYRSPEVYGEQGVGIGLYLARKIISSENGYIKVKSEKGKGSVFSVYLKK